MAFEKMEESCNAVFEALLKNSGSWELGLTVVIPTGGTLCELKVL
jgi:hypothetical protein